MDVSKLKVNTPPFIQVVNNYLANDVQRQRNDRHLKHQMKHRELTQPMTYAWMIGCMRTSAPTIEFTAKDLSHVFLPHDDL